MKRSLQRICFLFLLSPMIVFAQTPQPADTPATPGNSSSSATETVQEALDWVAGKLPDIKMSKYFDGSLTRRGYTEKYSYTIEFDAASCAVTINQKYSCIKDDRSGKNDYDVFTKYEFSLSDIKSIEIVENSPYYGVNSYVLKTINNKKSIKSGENQAVDQMAIKYNQLGELADKPERMLNAFNDAIKSCGGAKKEKY